MPLPSRRVNLSFLALILLLAAGLRLYRIDHQSYWNDEGNSLGLARQSVGAIVRSAGADIHPPGYYLALKAWRGLTGETEFAVRSLSALAGLVLVALLYCLGREYFGPPAPVAAALLGAVNPFLIYYAQEGRMYALLATLSAASFWLFSRWLRSSRPPAAPWGDWGTAGAYCLVSALGLYTHYAFGFVVIAQNLAAAGGLLAHRRGSGGKRFAAWLGLQAITLLMFAPWLPTAYRHLTTWPAERDYVTALAALAEATRLLALGRTIPTAEVTLALLSVGLLVLLGLRRRGQTITPLIWLIVPVGLTLGFGLLTEAFAKVLLVAVPPLCLLVGNGLGVGLTAPATGHRVRALRRSVSALGVWALGLGVLFYTYRSLDNLYFNPVYFRDDYRGIAQYVRTVGRPTDAIITIAPNQVEAFGYYHRSGAPVYPLPQARPLEPTRTAQSLAEIAAAHERLFVLYWGEDQADPDHFVEGWLNTNTFKVGDEWFGQVRLATYAAAAPAPEMDTASGARFGSAITLEGYTLKTPSVAPGDIVQLTLFWRADAPLEERYKVFVHLYRALDEPPVAQHDGEPAGGSAPTTTWVVGQPYADNHGVLIPPDLPAGEYQLVAGLYNLFDGTRLRVTLHGAADQDRLWLESVVVR